MSRYLSLVASLGVETTAGTAYAFGLYSDKLKSNLSYSQNDIDLVSSIGNLGGYSAFSGGLLFDAYGPLVAGSVGVALMLIGYWCTWAGANMYIAHTPGAMGFYNFLWGHGTSFLDNVVVGTTCRNFPGEFGAVMGIAKSFYGLTAGVFARVYSSWFADDSTASQFLVFLALTPLFSQGCLFFVKIAKTSELSRVDVDGKLFLHLVIGSIIVLSLYLALVSILTGPVGVHNSVGFTVGMLPLWAASLLFLIAWRIIRARKPRQASVNGEPQPMLFAPEYADDVPGVLGSARVAIGFSADRSEDDATAKDGSHVYGMTAMEAFLTIEFWLMVAIGFLVVGCGLMVINNIGQVVPSLKGSKSMAAEYVTLLSVANCLGRLFSGFLSDNVSKHVSRPILLAAACACMSVAHLILMIGQLQLLALGVVVTGLSYGAYWSLGPCLLKDVFGTRAIGFLYGVVGLSFAGSSFGLSRQLTASVYKAHSPKGSSTCVGKECFRTTFAVCALCSAVASALSVVLWLCVKRSTAAAEKKKAQNRMYDPLLQ